MPKDILSRIRDLFTSSSKTSQPFTHELIERSDNQQQNYEKWKNTRGFQQLLSEIEAGYKQSQQPEGVDHTQMIVIEKPSAKGFMLYFHADRHDPQDFQHLFDYLKEQILEKGYVTYVSDVKTHNKEESVETRERHYLKPRFRFDEEDQKAQQLFGNIKIEHILQDGQPLHLQFLCTSYRDQYYYEAKAFGDLMEEIVKPM